MFDQLSLFDTSSPPPVVPLETGGMPSPDQQLHSLFFALTPEPALAQTIANQTLGWVRENGVGGKPRPAEMLHISLHLIGSFTGEIPAERVQFARGIAQAISTQSFELTLDSAMSFKGKTPPYVLRVSNGLEQIQTLWRDIGMAIADAGGPSRDASFTPHMTLAYGQRVVPAHPIAPIFWTVKDFVLIDSHFGASSYRILGRWPLQGQM